MRDDDERLRAVVGHVRPEGREAQSDFAPGARSPGVTLAAETRAAVRARPFLYDALRAGVLTHRRAADLVLDDVSSDTDPDPDPDTVATALRRFADDLPPVERATRRATVRLRRGVGPVDTDPLLAVGGVSLGEADDDRTALLATGEVDPRALETVLGRLRVAGVGVGAAGVADGALVVVVADDDRTAALRAVEAALDAVPTG